MAHFWLALERVVCFKMKPYCCGSRSVIAFAATTVLGQKTTLIVSRAESLSFHSQLTASHSSLTLVNSRICVGLQLHYQPKLWEGLVLGSIIEELQHYPNKNCWWKAFLQKESEVCLLKIAAMYFEVIVDNLHLKAYRVGKEGNLQTLA